MPRKLKPALVAKIRAHLTTESGAVEPLASVAKLFGVSVWAIHRLRHELAPPTTGRSIIDQAIIEADRNPRQFIDRVMSGEAAVLTPDQQRAILAELILHTPNPAIKVSAQNALTRLDSQTGTAAILGPGVPLTDEARVDRLALLMSACGLPIIRRALLKSFPDARALQKSLDADSPLSEAVEDETPAPLAT